MASVSSSTSTSSSSSATSLLQVGGLASGIDTNSLLDQLTAVEQTKVTRVQTQEDNLTATREAFNNLASQVYSFADTAATLSDPTALDVFSSSTNDSTLATVSADDTNASAGNYSVVVQKLATAEKVASQSYSSITSALGLAGSFQISCSKAAVKNDPSTLNVAVNITASDSLKDVVSKINSAEGTSVKASIMTTGNGENRLVLTAVDQGSDTFSLKPVTGNILGENGGLEILSPEQSVRSKFNFEKATGGAADATTKFSELFTSISGNKLKTGDTITISGSSADGAITSTDFTIDATKSTLADLQAKVKAAFGANTDVSINKSGEFVLTNTGTGSGTMSMTMAYTGQDATSSMDLGSTKAKSSFINEITEGARSAYILDGTPICSQSNTDNTTVVGTNIKLIKADPTATVNLSLSLDESGVKSKINAFVTAYNNVMSYIKDQTKVTVSNSKSSSQQSVTSKGALANDQTTERLKSQLTSIVTSPVKELDGKTNYTSLSRLGITTDYQTGLLVVDDTKLTDAIEADMDGVKSLFAATGFSKDNSQFTMGKYNDSTKAGTYQVNADSGTISKSANGTVMTAALRSGDTLIGKSGDAQGLSISAPVGSGSGTFTFSRGIASALSYWVKQAKDPINGLFVQTDKSYQKQLDDYDQRITDLQTQVDSYRATMSAQFTAMEQAMQKLKSQSSSMSTSSSS